MAKTLWFEDPTIQLLLIILSLLLILICIVLVLKSYFRYKKALSLLKQGKDDDEKAGQILSHSEDYLH